MLKLTEVSAETYRRRLIQPEEELCYTTLFIYTDYAHAHMYNPNGIVFQNPKRNYVSVVS